MKPLLDYLRAYTKRKHVRPWALSAPIVVLLICLPLLRPLRHPMAWQMSDDEIARWGTVQALVEQQTFAIDRTQFTATRQKVHVDDVSYSDQPPVMGLLLSAPYWLIRQCGYTFSNNPALVEYLLTLLAVTLPVAAAAGLIYRMSRLFELRRPWRAGLALAVILGSGTISYATVLNPFAPAAALVLAAAAVMVQVAIVNSPLRSGGYLAAAGIFAALAAVIDPAAVVFTILFAAVILAMRWRWSLRIAGVLMYIIGVVPPLLLHVSLSVPITGDWRLGLAPLPAKVVHQVKATPANPPVENDQDLLSGPPTWSQRTASALARLVGAFFGTHGLLTHFPILIFGGIGIGIVFRRHWPGTTKTLAIVTVAGAAIVILRYVWLPVDWRWAMFGVRWYIVFLPLLLFWAGAWLRRSHEPIWWAIAAVLLAFSSAVSLIGATDPTPRNGYDHYTAAAALHNLTSSGTPDDLPVLAER
jgi:MFS family permease